jgi:hypothetical protein
MTTALMLIAGLRGHFTTAAWAGIPPQWERLVSYGKIPGGKVPGTLHLSRVIQGVTEPRPAGSDTTSAASSAFVVALPAGRGSVFVFADPVFAHPNVGNRFLTRGPAWATLKYGYRSREMAGPIKPR